MLGNLRNKYGRDKKKLQKAKRSGTGTASVKQAEKDISEMYPYLQQVEPYVQPSQSCSNLVDLTETTEIDENSSENESADCVSVTSNIIQQ